jgi:nitrate/nitrite transporter NarK
MKPVGNDHLQNTHTHTHTHTDIYIYIYIYINVFNPFLSFSMFMPGFILSCYESNKQESKRDRSMFQVQNPQATLRLLDVTGQEREAVIHQFIIQDSVLAHVCLT